MNNNSSERAEEIFKKVINGKNFVTPTIINYYKIKNGACELAGGTLLYDVYYGVTVVKNNKYNETLSKSFETIERAKTYINTLK